MLVRRPNGCERNLCSKHRCIDSADLWTKAVDLVGEEFQRMGVALVRLRCELEHGVVRQCGFGARGSLLGKPSGDTTLKADLRMAVRDHGKGEAVGCAFHAGRPDLEHVVDGEVATVAHEFVKLLAVGKGSVIASRIVARAPD